MTSREEMPQSVNLPPKKRHYQETPAQQATIYKNIPVMLSKNQNENVQVHRTDSRPLLVLDTQGRPINQHVSVTTHQTVQNGGQRTHYTTVQNNQHIQTNVHTGNGGNTDGSGKISQVVYTSGPSFGAHQPQYAYAHNGFINTVQGPMTQILPANLSQGQTYQTVMTTNEPMQPQLLLSKPLIKTAQTGHPNSTYPKTIPKSAIHISDTNGKTHHRNLQLGTFKVTNSNSSFRTAQTVQYRKITSSQAAFPRPDMIEIPDRQTQKRFKHESYVKHDVKQELDSTNDDSMYDSSFDSTETQPYFEAGSLIKLENGECKKVEELSRADFETCGYNCADKRLITAVLISIDKTDQDDLINLTFMVDNNPENKVKVVTSKDWPFWSTKANGWASIEPNLTEKKYKLQCRKLKIQDEIFSLEKKNNDNKTAIASYVDSNGHRIHPSIVSSDKSAFRPIQHEKNSEKFHAASERLAQEQSSQSPTKRVRRRSFSDSEFLELKRKKEE